MSDGRKRPGGEPNLAIPEIRTMDVADLKPAPYNPRRIDPAALAGLTKSLDQFGDVQPIVWNKRSNLVVAGHQRLKAKKAKGEKQTTVIVVDLDEKDEKTLNITLNNPGISGEFTAELQGLLEEIQDADQILFHALRLDTLLAEGDHLPPGAEPNAVPAAPKTAVTQPGDLYILGAHRLLCGDSTVVTDVDRLLAGDKVDAMVTDPPYGVDYGAKNAFLNVKGKGNHVQRDITNDISVEGGYRKWFASWLSIVPWAEYACYFVFMSNMEVHNLRNACDDLGFHFGSLLVWLKNVQILGRADYLNKHELILYGWPERHRFYADGHPSTILEYDKPRKSELHPTMKPVELCQKLIEDGSPSGAIVYEPFGGSGSTLIASELAHRQCRVIEVDPIYCDVIVQRWEEFTGKKAVRG